MCLETCDPFAQTCGPELGCFHANMDFVCMRALGALEGETCTFTNDCAAGLGCFDAELSPVCEGESCCVAYCDVDDVGACPELGVECTVVFEAGFAPPGLEPLGVCAAGGACGDGSGCGAWEAALQVGFVW